MSFRGRCFLFWFCVFVFRGHDGGEVGGGVVGFVWERWENGTVTFSSPKGFFNMNFKTLKQLSEKSLVSDFRLKIKVVCVFLLIPPIAIELYNLFFTHNKLYFPVLEFGAAIWSFVCGIFLIFMMFSDFLKRISLKSEINFSSIRRKIMLLTGIFLFMTVIFSVLFMWEFKNRRDWQQGVSEVENLLFQMEQEER